MALTPTDLGDNTGASVSSITLASLSITAGELVTSVVNIGDPFDAAVVTGVTLNGVAMTQAIAKKGASGGSQWYHTSTWHITAGTTGTYDIVATFDASATTCQITGRKYTGFDTGTPIGDTDSIDANASGTIALTLTTAVGDEVLDGKAAENYGANESANGSQTALYDATEFGVSFLSASGTSTAVGWSNITNAGYVYTAVVIKAAASGAAITAANTLGAATSSATVKGRAGTTSAKTLGTLTSAATVKARAGITSAKTLGTLTSAATAGGPRQITAAMTLGQLGSSASMLLINPSQANNTLGQLTSAATVKAIGTITSSKTLGSLTSVAGINVNTLSAANTLGALTSSASANGIASISSAKTLGTLTAAAFIAPNSIITGSPTLDAMVSQAVIAHGHVMRPTWTRKPSHSATWTRRA